ncbi:hypothetical protein FFK22_036480 [Mycobacterium sp. KBS0706]|uniref:hypothetical protein n=1 Tax=Mycobacterium sp. KBS0706 TaxID=2578109 RepID=UPI00110FD89C|nr:hypothetical protein [Mycobacterium sp. KBS0706]TSD83695.1 hypothetical protein FFK22_036480 [Mycobacterium sp. KBS0706]
MADSDDTTTLPALSRRALLGGATVLPIGAADARRRGANSDPVLDLFQEWRALDAELDAWQDDWQQKEGVLLRTIGMPRVLVPVPGKAEPVSACEPAEIDELLEDLPGTEELRQGLHREFAAHRRRWEIAAAAIGLGPVEERVNLAWDRWEALTETVWQVPAGSLAGVAAKLAMVLTMGQPRCDDEEFPWPPLRSLLADLQRLGKLPDGMVSTSR